MTTQLRSLIVVLGLAIVQVGCGGGGGGGSAGGGGSGGGGSGGGGSSGADLSGQAGVDQGTGGGSMTASVDVGPGIAFSPTSTTIARGGTVTWTWSGGIPHSVTSGTCTSTCTADGKFTSTTQSSGTYSFTFATSGDYPYYCLVHGSMMTATVHVQ